MDTKQIEPNRNGVAPAGTPEPEVVPKVRRRTFSAKYKLRVVREADACTRPGEVGALLRREGLYSSHLSKWRKQREDGSLEGLTPRRRGRKANPEARRIAKLEKEVERLRRELEQAQTIITVQKKLADLLRSLQEDEPETPA